jgi:hypothetical protein
MNLKTKSLKKRKKINMAKPNTPNMAPMPPMPEGAPMPAAPADAGSVMVTIPKGAFMEIHNIVIQLAQALDALALEVEAASGGAGPMAPEMAGEMPPMPAGAPSDADLEAFAAELSQRGAM